MSRADVTYRANEWVWWRAAVESYRQEWIATRQARLERDLTDLIRLVAEAAGYHHE